LRFSVFTRSLTNMQAFRTNKLAFLRTIDSIVDDPHRIE